MTCGDLLDPWLARFRAWRRLRGGHWELWYWEHPGTASWWRRTPCVRDLPDWPTRLAYLMLDGRAGVLRCEDHG